MMTIDPAEPLDKGGNPVDDLVELEHLLTEVREAIEDGLLFIERRRGEKGKRSG